MSNIKVEKIRLDRLSRGQRKHLGMIAQRHLERDNGTVDTLRTLLREYVDAECDRDTRAAQWLLARLVADPFSEINCKKYIWEALYG